MIVDITAKPETLRSARAQATLTLPPEAAQTVRNNAVKKGDVATAARLAGIMAVKRTWELLPHCHPLQLEQCEVEVELREDVLHIEVSVACIGSTGVEMEAMTGASIAGLTAYDMLKPHCDAKGLVLGDVRLLEKTGGKTDFPRQLKQPHKAAILVIHDPRREREVLHARSAELAKLLDQAGFSDIRTEHILADADTLGRALDASSEELILSMGSSGHRRTDCAPDVTRERIVRDMPGLMDAARQHGLRRTPYAALSRGVAGYNANGQLLINLPSTSEGWAQAWQALKTPVLHLLNRGN